MLADSCDYSMSPSGQLTCFWKCQWEFWKNRWRVDKSRGHLMSFFICDHVILKLRAFGCTCVLQTCHPKDSLSGWEEVKLACNPFLHDSFSELPRTAARAHTHTHTWDNIVIDCGWPSHGIDLAEGLSGPKLEWPWSQRRTVAEASNESKHCKVWQFDSPWSR